MNLRVLHIVKHYINETESWFRSLLTTSPHEVAVATRLLLPGTRPVPGVEVRVLRPGWDSVRDVSADSSTRRWLSSFDVIHAHFVDTAWSALALLDGSRARFVVSAYGVDLSSLPRSRPDWPDRYERVFSRADAVVVQGPAGAPRIQEWGARPAQTHVIPIGVPSADILDCARVRRSGPLRFLQVATYREKKGHRDTVGAFLAAFGARGNARLSLVGDPPLSRDTGEYASVIADIRRAGLGSVVSMHGAVARREFLALLDGHDVFVQPSRTTAGGDVEGGPVAVLDAQARGRPVLATAHENIPMLVDHDLSGFLTPEADPAALADSMSRVSARLWQGDHSMSANAIAVARRFTAEAASDSFARLYEGLVE